MALDRLADMCLVFVDRVPRIPAVGTIRSHNLKAMDVACRHRHFVVHQSDPQAVLSWHDITCCTMDAGSVAFVICILVLESLPKVKQFWQFGLLGHQLSCNTDHDATVSVRRTVSLNCQVSLTEIIQRVKFSNQILWQNSECAYTCTRKTGELRCPILLCFWCSGSFGSSGTLLEDIRVPMLWALCNSEQQAGLCCNCWPHLPQCWRCILEKIIEISCWLFVRWLLIMYTVRNTNIHPTRKYQYATKVTPKRQLPVPRQRTSH